MPEVLLRAALLMMLTLLVQTADAAEVMYGPEPVMASALEGDVHVLEDNRWGRGMHAERHFKAARWLRRGELVACGLIPVVMPDEVRRDEGTAWLGTVLPPVCSLALGAKATNHTLRAADLAYTHRPEVARLARRAAMMRSISTALFMATWGDFVSFGRIRDWDAEQRRRALLLTSVSLTLVSIPLERAAWRTVHAAIAGTLPEAPHPSSIE